MFKEKLAKLIDVKSIVTILLTVVFCVLMFCRDVIPSEFIQIYTVIIAFYFGTQTAKTSKKEGE